MRLVAVIWKKFPEKYLNNKDQDYRLPSCIVESATMPSF